MRNAPYDGIDQSNGAGTHVSAWIPATQLFAFSATVKAGGTLAGTLKVQVSDDGPNTRQADIVGGDLTGASIAVGAGAFGIIPKVDSAYNWVRLSWTSSGGAGSVLAKFKGSGF